MHVTESHDDGDSCGLQFGLGPMNTRVSYLVHGSGDEEVVHVDVLRVRRRQCPEWTVFEMQGRGGVGPEHLQKHSHGLFSVIVNIHYLCQCDCGVKSSAAANLKPVDELELQQLRAAGNFAERRVVVWRVVTSRAILPPDLPLPVDDSRPHNAHVAGVVRANHRAVAQRAHYDFVRRVVRWETVHVVAPAIANQRLHKRIVALVNRCEERAIDLQPLVACEVERPSQKHTAGGEHDSGAVPQRRPNSESV